MALENTAVLPRMSFEEYLLRETNASSKSEFFYGHVYAMAGARFGHNLIAGNCLGALRDRLRARGCAVLGSDQIVECVTANAAFYPDVTVICGNKMRSSALQATEPEMIVEVLSPSTRNHDQTNKLEEYKLIPSLQHILFLESESVGAQLYTRDAGGNWPALAYNYLSIEDMLPLRHFDTTLPLREIYENVSF